MKRIISTWMEEVRNLRTYTIIIEFFTTKKTLHARGVFANNYRIHLDKGFYVFIPWTNKVHVDGDSFNKLDIKSYLHSPFDKGDTLMDVAIMELERISKKYANFLRNTGDPIIVEPIKEHYNQNYWCPIKKCEPTEKRGQPYGMSPKICNFAFATIKISNLWAKLQIFPDIRC